MLLSACSMARGQEETSTSQVGRRRGPSQESPSESSIIFSISMDEVRSYCQIPEDIDFKLSEGQAESTMGEEYNAVFFTPGATRSRASLPHVVPGQAILALHQSVTFLYSPKRHSDSNWMLRTKPSLSTGPFIGGSLLCLHLEASAQWSAIHVSLEPPAAIHYGTPRFAQVRGERSDPSKGTLG